MSGPTPTAGSLSSGMPFPGKKFLGFRLIFAITLLTVMFAGSTLYTVGRFLIQSEGEALAVLAADVATMLDRILFERYADIGLLAQAPFGARHDTKALTTYLNKIQSTYQSFQGLSVTDAQGIVLAATMPSLLGTTMQNQNLFQAIKSHRSIEVQDIHPVPALGNQLTVIFGAPIGPAEKSFSGAVFLYVKVPFFARVLGQAAKNYTNQRTSPTHLEWQLLTKDGLLAIDSLLQKEGTVNLRQLGLPSALPTSTGDTGYIEETHLRRQVPVVTGYAATHGLHSFKGLGWRVLIRRDQSEVLAPMERIFLAMTVMGMIVIGPMIAMLIRSTHRFQTAQNQLATQQQNETKLVAEKLAKTEKELVRHARLAMLGKLGGNVAHELRNPLGTIRNAVHLIKKNLTTDDQETHEFANMIEEEVQRCNGIITDLLALARGKDPVKEWGNLASIVQDARELVNPPPGIQTRFSFDPSPFLLWVDVSQLERVLINLMTNAIQAMGEKGIVTVIGHRTTGEDVITVKDNGPGISSDIRQTLFEPLVTAKTNGTGLGLTLCRQIMEGHGGSIELVHSEEGGAAFCLRVPRP